MALNISLFVCALGLALVFEGLPYFLFPEKMPFLFELLASLHPGRLRCLGLSAILMGLIIVYIGRHL